MESLNLKGRFKIEHFRAGKLLASYEKSNLITTAGKNKLLDTAFQGATQITQWYMGLIDNAGFSANSASDTMGSHTGWTEFEDYDESTREAWTVASASGGSISNAASVAEFTINDSGVLKGAFITSNNTKGGTTGTLWSSYFFNGTVTVVSGDVLKLTYILAC